MKPGSTAKARHCNRFQTEPGGPPKTLGVLRRAFYGFVNTLDPLQILQKLAPAAAKVLRPGPFHAGVLALPAAVKMAAGDLKAVFGVQNDEFLSSHVWNLPDCGLRRNLSPRTVLE